eukprot:gene17398-22947_t
MPILIRRIPSLSLKGDSIGRNPLDSPISSSLSNEAPCYKRLPFLHYNNPENQSLRHNTRESEFWLDHDYSNQFHTAFDINGYDLRTLQRTGHKTDAVALAIKKETFSIEGSHNISLCSIGDRCV